MQRSTIEPAAGGGPLARGLLPAGALVYNGAGEPADVSAETVSGSEAQLPDELLEAMKRDLGLSEAEAAELVTAEAEARSTDSELRSSLGEGYGGSWFDIES